MNQIDDTLAKVFAYDAVDLAANRAGQLSPDQHVMFTRAAHQARRRAPRVMGMLVLVLGAVFGFLAVQGTVPMNQLAIGGAVAMIFVALIGLLSLLNYRQANKMEHMQVRVTEGLPIASPSGYDGHWRLDVGGVRFNIMSGDIDFFNESTVYRIYHAYIGVGTPVILSLEVVR